MAGVIAAQSQEVSDLVDDLLTAERAASGNLTIRAAPTQLELELKSVIDLLLEPPAVFVLDSVTVIAHQANTRPSTARRILLVTWGASLR